jgi:hypothetical protein
MDLCQAARRERAGRYIVFTSDAAARGWGCGYVVPTMRSENAFDFNAACNELKPKGIILWSQSIV